MSKKISPRGVRPVILILVQLMFFLDSGAANLPANGWLVWSSNREDGRHEIYLKKVNEQVPTRLTTSGGNYPMWSPDGKWISYFNTTDGWATIMRPDGSEQKPVCNSKKYDWTGGGQFWMYDGSGLVCVEDDAYYLYSPATQQRSKLFEKDDVPALVGQTFEINSISRDGTWVAGVTELFRYGYTAENGSFTAMYSAMFFSLGDKSKVYFLGQGCEPTFSPTLDRIYHVCSKDCDNPTDIVQMEIADRMTRSSYEEVVSYPDNQWGHEYYPRISNDGKWLAYAAALTHAGDYNIYIHELGADVKQRELVVDHTAVDNFPQLFIGQPYGIECTTAGQCSDPSPCLWATCTSFKCESQPISGCCTTATACDDGNMCTDDSCDGDHLCKHTPKPSCCKKDSDCVDTNPCTEEACDEGTGTCSNPISPGCCASDMDCQDNDDCTEDRCDTDNQCIHPLVANCCRKASECVDDSPCTDDTCQGGACLNIWIAGCCDKDAGCSENADSGVPRMDFGISSGDNTSDIPVSTPGNGRLMGGCSVSRHMTASAADFWLLMVLLFLFTLPIGRGYKKPRM